MNKSLKFLAIGLALAVLLVSQVGVDRTAEAAAVALDDEEVSFTNADGEEKDYFKPGDTVDFYLMDDSLALPTSNQKTTVTWALGSNIGQEGGPIPARDEFSLVTGVVGSVFDEALAQDNFNSTSSKWAQYAPGGDAGATPLVGAPTVTVYEDDGQEAEDGNGDPQGDGINGNGPGVEFDTTRISRSGGTFQLLDRIDQPSGNGSTTIEAVFEYEVQDVFGADPKGTGAKKDKNRAKVTSSSDGVGAWVEISEVETPGITTASSVSDVYYGSVVLTDDAREASTNANMVWVRDGDTLTVTFYEDDHVTEIDSDEATIDAEDPSITGFDPSNKTVTDDETPPVTFTMTDDGAGFETSGFRSNVDLLVKDGTSICKIPDGELTATSLTQGEVEILFRSSDDWGSDGLECAMPNDRDPDEQFDADEVMENAGIGEDDETGMFVAEAGAAFVGTLAVRTEQIGDNNHGVQFNVIAVSEDGAGNIATANVGITIDTVKPGFDQNETQTGKTWDAKKKKEADSRSTIRVAFTESLDASTVDVDDFTVEDPDVSIEEVIVGGVNDDDGKFKNERVYLVLSEELPSDSLPRVELDGSIRDVAGNELKKAAISRVEDGISPGITVDAFSAQLLAEDGETTVTFASDENMGATAATMQNGCTCLGIAGGGGSEDIGADPGVAKGNVGLPTPSTATHTFKQSGRVTGIYGLLVQASDSRANLTKKGAKKVSNEEVTATVDAEDTDLVTFSLKKWPLADADFTGTLSQAVKVSKSSGGTALGTAEGEATTTAMVVNVDWENGKVTMDLMGHGVATDDTLYATYSYVDAAQVVQVDLDPPEVTFSPSGDTQESRPFIRIMFDDKEYAGDSHTTVTVTSATLTDPDDNETELVGTDVNLLGTNDDKLFSYLPESDLALGEYTISAIGKDAAGNVTEEMTGKFKVVARPKVTIPLTLGWNLISLPAEPSDSSIDVVIDVPQVSQVLTYDPTAEGGWLAAVRVNGSFEGALTDIDATRAYLIYTTSEQDLKVDIPPPSVGETLPAIQLHAGWNLVPASSLDASFPVRDTDDYFSGLMWTRGYYYGSDGKLVGFKQGDSSDEADSDKVGDDAVIKGRGFFLYLTEDGVLVP